MSNILKNKRVTNLVNKMIIFVLFFSIIIGLYPQQYLLYADEIENYDFDFITSIEITDIEGNELTEPISSDTEIKINYNFRIPNDIDVNEGDKYTITIPKEIEEVSKDFLDIPLNDNDGNTIAYANFYTDNTVDIIFTDYVENENLSDVSGNFWIERSFDFSEIDNSGETDIVFELNGKATYKITVKFETVPEKTNINIEKTNSYNKENNKITWTIKLIPKTSPTPNLEIRDVVLTDLIEENQTYVEGTLKIQSNINNWLEDEEVSITEPNELNNEFKLEFLNLINKNNNEEYIITYETIPDTSAFESEGQSKTFSNTAIVKYKDIETDTTKEESATSNLKITSDFISKTGKYNKNTKQITWTVKVNNNYFNIPAGAIIEDIIPKGLELITDSIKLDGTSIIPVDSGPLTIIENTNEDTSTLAYKFNSEINETHILTYITNVVDENAYNSNTQKTFNNEAIFIGNSIPDNAKAGVGVKVYTQVISKNGVKYNTSTHEIEWKIVVNSNEIEIENPVITDIIPDGLEYIDGTFKVNGNISNDGLTYNKDSKELTYNFSGLKDENNNINNTFTLTFNTKVLNNDVYGTNGSEKFTNKATLTGDNIPETSNSGSITYKSEVLLKESKGFDYVNKIIDWEITVNKNQMEMTNTKVEDIIPEGHELIDSSIKINGVNAVKSPIEGYEYDEDNRKLIYNFPETITEQYKINFQTKVVDLSIFNTNETILVENTAILYGDEISEGKIESTATQIIKSILVDKTGEYEDGDSFIKWNVLVNRDQLEINNPILEDELQEGLILDTSTIKLFEVNINTDGTYLIEDEMDLTNENIEYDLSTNTFKFKFNQNIEKAYLLEFQTDIDLAYKDATFTNEISFTGSNGSETGGAESIKVKIQEVGGNATAKNGSITIIKVDKNDITQKLQGAKFQLLNKFGETISEIKETDENGTVVFDKLKFDIPYTIKEIEAPIGYSISGNGEYTFEIDSSNKDIIYTMENDILRTIEITKVDKDDYNKFLSNAIFEVRDNTNTVIGEITTDSNGKGSLEGLNFGEYTIREIKAPNGYKKDNNIVEITIAETSPSLIEILWENVKKVESGGGGGGSDPEDQEDPQDPETQPEIDPEDSETQPETDPDLEGNNDKDGENIDDSTTGDETIIEDDIPLGNVEDDKLPQTGYSTPVKLYLLGFLLIMLGVIIKVKYKKSLN